MIHNTTLIHPSNSNFLTIIVDPIDQSSIQLLPRPLPTLLSTQYFRLSIPPLPPILLLSPLSTPLPPTVFSHPMNSSTPIRSYTIITHTMNPLQMADNDLKQYIDQVFVKYDRERDGTLKTLEMANYLTELFQLLGYGEVNVTVEEAQQAVKMIDRNNDNKITKMELFLAFKELANTQISDFGGVKIFFMGQGGFDTDIQTLGGVGTGGNKNAWITPNNNLNVKGNLPQNNNAWGTANNLNTNPNPNPNTNTNTNTNTNSDPWGVNNNQPKPHTLVNPNQQNGWGAPSNGNTNIRNEWGATTPTNPNSWGTPPPPTNTNQNPNPQNRPPKPPQQNMWGPQVPPQTQPQTQTWGQQQGRGSGAQTQQQPAWGQQQGRGSGAMMQQQPQPTWGQQQGRGSGAMMQQQGWGQQPQTWGQQQGRGSGAQIGYQGNQTPMPPPGFTDKISQNLVWGNGNNQQLVWNTPGQRPGTPPSAAYGASIGYGGMGYGMGVSPYSPVVMYDPYSGGYMRVGSGNEEGTA